jgi:hypothetical protein
MLLQKKNLKEGGNHELTNASILFIFLINSKGLLCMQFNWPMQMKYRAGGWPKGLLVLVLLPLEWQLLGLETRRQRLDK